MYLNVETNNNQHHSNPIFQIDKIIFKFEYVLLNSFELNNILNLFYPKLCPKYLFTSSLIKS